MRYPKGFSAWAVSCTFLLASCGGTDNDVEGDLQIDRSNTGFAALFAPADGIIPFPSNLLFSGSADGTLNIPVANANDFSDPSVALNILDGFSTIAPIKTTFSRAIEAATLTSQTVHLYEVTLSIGGAVTSVVRPLTYGTEFIASVSPVDPDGKTLIISPLAPLKAKTSYMVALTSGIQSTDGRTAAAEATYIFTQSTSPLVDGGGVSQVATLLDAQAVALEPLRTLTNFQEIALAGQGIHSESVVLSWSFTTQSIGDVLTQARAQALANATSAISSVSIGDTAFLLNAGPGLADVYAGSLTLPYYLTNGTTPTDPLSNFWQGVGGSNLTQFNPTPVKTSDETVPLLVSIPKTGSAPWPVVIFQHGITSNRTAMLAIADALASAGFAAVAIDMPLHGLPVGHPLRFGPERTFDLDLANNTTGAPGSDAIADTSGTHYINLTNLAVTRDNVRQSVADLFALFDSLSTMDYDGGGVDFDTSNVYFVGHSLGAMAGIPFLALEPGVKEAVLGMPGSGIAKLLDGSASFGPRIAAGLAASGVVKGTADYESFMGAAQTLVDSGDPGNYAALAASGRGILLLEVIGDGASNLPDQVIPINVMADAPADTTPAPLSGTDPLATLLGLTRFSSTTLSGTSQLAQIRFTAGDHASLLDPSESAAATTVMQTAAVTFLASDGLQITISDTAVVE
ncbi:MAG: Ig-like domain-containing protein [Thiotrichaceae bacterium]|nr:Ig-like domain-containing protein [Thiotrichaceae bacterium]PCI11836.1 MAG: lipase [Thiotrichales bacterium]